ncbi:glycosyltransferase [Gracilibacillus dipsosauri]|uniref:glycosyltransferase n=1 Tax=Gracilibacillus dipsosauri TaxID=178340 RepID=UPI00240987F9
MRILVNLSIIQSGGGMQVAHSLINELKTHKNNEYLILASNKILALITKEPFPDNFNFNLVESSPSRIFSGARSRKQLSQAELEFRPDVVFTLFGPPYWKPQAPHLCGFALAQHLYKESPFFTVISFRERLKLKVKEFIKFLSFKHHCDYWVTEMPDVSSRLAKKLGVPRDKVFTVNNVYNNIYDQPDKWKRPRFDVKPDTLGYKLLTISSFHTHKNLAIIPKVIDYLKERYPTFNFTFILTVYEESFSGLTDQHKGHMLFLGPILLEECPLLYQYSDALFMPTLLECFTVSYLEAMKMERPILTSDLPFANDICQYAALYFDPLDAKNIGDKIVKLANNEDLRNKLVDSGRQVLVDFGTAAERTQAYLSILEKIVKYN